MRMIKLIVSVTLIAMLGLYVLHADAQTMGEYAGATAGVGTGAGSMGTSINSSIGSNDLGGGSRTWGASSLGETFDQRAGTQSAAGGAPCFDSRAGQMASESGAGSGSRWPGSGFQGNGTADRFSSTDRFSSAERFPQHTELSGAGDRFPASQFNDNRLGLDTNYNRSGLDKSGSADGLDTDTVPINY